MAALNDTPAPRWDMVKNNQLQLWLTNKEHALNFDPFSKWTFITLMNYNFLIEILQAFSVPFCVWGDISGICSQSLA